MIERSFRVDEDLYTSLKVVLVSERKTFSSWIRQQIENELESRGIIEIQEEIDGEE
jgi:hypothetical protein